MQLLHVHVKGRYLLACSLSVLFLSHACARSHTFVPLPLPPGEAPIRMSSGNSSTVSQLELHAVKLTDLNAM